MATIDVTIDGQSYAATVHLEKTDTKIKVTRAGVKDSNELRDLALSGPILLVKKAKFAGMHKPAAALLMDPADFKAIYDAVHAGAFGYDYGEVETKEGGKLMALWKLAADLNGIDGFEAVPVPVDVGTYAMCDDWRLCKFTAGGRELVNRGAPITKMRFDNSTGGKVTSVHHLELAYPPHSVLASISTDKFFEDFYQIEKNADEKERVQSMFKRLIGECDIRPLLCNSTQHQIIFLEYKDTVLNPPEFASLLKENDTLCEIIRNGLAERGYGGRTITTDENTERFNVWKKDYIKTFGSEVAGSQ